MWELNGAISRGNHVIASQSEIVETRGITSPAGSIRFLAADDVRGRAHLHRAHPHGTFHQGDFELNGRAGLKIAWREEIDAARADIFCDERNRYGFGLASDTRQAQGKSQMSARSLAALPRHAERVRGNARKVFWPWLVSIRRSYCGAAFKFTQRRNCGPLPVTVRSSPHVPDPQDLPRIDPSGCPNMLASVRGVKKAKGESAVKCNAEGAAGQGPQWWSRKQVGRKNRGRFGRKNRIAARIAMLYFDVHESDTYGKKFGAN
jgi:hypothetical protein